MTRPSKREIERGVEELEGTSGGLETLDIEELYMLGLKGLYGYADLSDEELDRVWSLWREKIPRGAGRSGGR